jgi:N-acetylglucosaminyl-diphospho-decaprenol L-rhamnosyltransferase
VSEGPRIAIVVVTWNSRAVLGPCLDAIGEHPGPAPLEIVVVDNGSSDGTAELAREHPLAPRVIVNGSNRGLAAANNQGIEAATAPFVMIANPDTLVTEGAIAALLDVLERRPRACFAVPRLRYPDGRPQSSAGGLPSLADAVLGRQVSAALGRRDSGFWWDGWAHDEERRIGRGHEACYLVRRAAIDEFGLQDEGFGLDWEGIDWAARAAESGWEVWFTPAAEVIHVGGHSIRQARLRWIAGSHRGMYRYYAKRTTPVLRPLLAALIALRGGVKLLAAAGPASYERSHRT